MLGLRHYQKRKKANSKNVTAKNSVVKEVLDLLIYPAAILAPLALLPQVWTLYTTHSAAGLAFSTWLILGALNILWFVYGKVHRERPIMLTNAALMVLNFAVAVGVLLYR